MTTAKAELLASRVRIDREWLAAFCHRHHIRRLSVFGSVLRDDYRAESDIDILVEFQPGATVGLLRLASMEGELSRELDRTVDLRTPTELSRYFRQQVMDMAEVVYATA